MASGMSIHQDRDSCQDTLPIFQIKDFYFKKKQLKSASMNQD